MSRYFTKDHEWIDLDGTVGITDYAQSQLGDITYVELPSVGASFGAGDAAATGVVDPGATRLLDLIHRFLGEENRAGETGRRGDGLFEEDEGVVLFELGGGDVGAGVVEEEFVLKLDELVTSAALDGGLADETLGRDAAVTREVIPYDFQAIGGNREGTS